jgi:hypothetical protein
LPGIECFVQQDCEGVWLFTGRTSADPDPQIFAGWQTAKQLRDYDLLEVFKGGLIAKESRHPDKQIFIERIQLVIVIAQAGDVSLEILRMA